MRSLPPLNALRAFESAGRLLSISKAAEELHVTPGAVSQQIKTLEEYLGVQLFRRLNRQIELTDAARQYLPQMTDALDQLALATAGLRQQDESRPLTVSMSPTFGARWLVPRLTRFKDQHPDIDVRIDATTDLVDLHDNDIDLAIRFGAGRYDGLESHCLLSQSVIPVCSPDIVKSTVPLDDPADLLEYTLLHGDYPFGEYAWPDWNSWFHTIGVEYDTQPSGLRFTQPDLIIQAALAGQGVALAGNIAVAEEIEAGRLVQLFNHSVSPAFSYFLVWASEKSKRPKLTAFKQWLIDETANHAKC